MPEQPNLTHPAEVRALLARLEFRPSRVLGQNFLIDRNILNILLEAAGVQPGDEVIEVGPGLGVLTEALLERTGGVTAIEKDTRLASYLRERLGHHAGLNLLHGDALEADWPALCQRPDVKLVANLPYAIASRLLVEWSGIPLPPAVVVATIQREVAERLTATPGTSEYGLLSILLQRRYDIRIVKRISRTCFWPPPEIQSAIVRLELRPAPLGGEVDERALRDLLRHAFSRRRKTMVRSLRDRVENPAPALAEAGIAPTARAEQIPPEIWPALLRALTRLG